MRFNHNDISYYINPNCEGDKENRMKQAFTKLTLETDNLIKFYPAREADADILIGCDPDSYEKEENIFIAGEGGPTRIINSSFSVITKGKVLLYDDSRAICDEPILQIHELLHVFGYDHIDNEAKIMYPYLDCEQQLNRELIDHMIEIYTIQPFADVYFENIDANKERTLGKWYLNFNVSLNNQGIINAEETVLKINSGSKTLKSFELNTIAFGGGKNFYVTNLPITSSSIDIDFVIETKTNDNNLGNNIVELKAQ